MKKNTTFPLAPPNIHKKNAVFPLGMAITSKNQLHMGVSKNMGTPKSSIPKKGFPLFSPFILGAVPLFLGNIHIHLISRGYLLGIYPLLLVSSLIPPNPWHLQHLRWCLYEVFAAVNSERNWGLWSFGVPKKGSEAF